MEIEELESHIKNLHYKSKIIKLYAYLEQIRDYSYNLRNFSIYDLNHIPEESQVDEVLSFFEALPPKSKHIQDIAYEFGKSFIWCEISHPLFNMYQQYCETVKHDRKLKKFYISRDYLIISEMCRRQGIMMVDNAIYDNIAGYWHKMFGSREDFFPYLLDWESHENYYKFIEGISYYRNYRRIKIAHDYNNIKSYEIAKKYKINIPEIIFILDSVMDDSITPDALNALGVQPDSNKERLCETIAKMAESIGPVRSPARVYLHATSYIIKQKFNINESSTQQEKLYAIVAAYNLTYKIIRPNWYRPGGNGILLTLATEFDNIAEIYRLPSEVHYAILNQIRVSLRDYKLRDDDE